MYKYTDMDAIQTDIQNIEDDVKKINCYAVYDLIINTIKCIKDFIACCFKKST